MNKRRSVDALQAGDKLVREEQHRLERELALTKDEELIQTGTNDVEDHGVVYTVGAIPADNGNADTAAEGSVDASLIFKLGPFDFNVFKLDGNLLAEITCVPRYTSRKSRNPSLRPMRYLPMRYLPLPNSC